MNKEAKAPNDLRRVLTANPKAGEIWNNLTPIARRDFVRWVESAKQEETRKRRVESIPSRLASGKRRPCCYAMVPMGIYKALDENSNAKATWKDLTPTERRDFVEWIDEAKEKGANVKRIEKACELLSKGKRHP